MATREENLKKINAELEMLSDEELENVVGGTWKQVNELSKALWDRSIDGLGWSELEKKKIVRALRDYFDIEADLSIGLLGTGIGSKQNTYKYKYRFVVSATPLTHQQVLDIIHAERENGFKVPV